MEVPHSNLSEVSGMVLVKVDAGLVEVGVVGVNVEVPHSNLSEVSGMVLVKVDPVVMLTTSVSTTSGMLPVLPDPSVSVRHVSSQPPGLLLGCGHCGTSLVEVNQALICL